MRSESLRPYTVTLLVPLWIAGGIANASGYRTMGAVTMVAMFAIVLDSIMTGGGRPWPLRRTMATTCIAALSVVGGIALAGYGTA